ncbi:MAG: hypothetical protein KGS61_11720 [Verrucomicrobia bacterium]|nr:hypothetical protein [Verrucomicrobiota bacterium]
MELALGSKATIHDQELRIGNHVITLDRRLQIATRFPSRDDLEYIGFDALLDGKLDAKTFHDKVVILGYDGNRMQKLPTPMGEIKAHRLFCYGLFDLYRRMTSSRKR